MEAAATHGGSRLAANRLPPGYRHGGSRLAADRLPPGYRYGGSRLAGDWLPTGGSHSFFAVSLSLSAFIFTLYNSMDETSFLFDLISLIIF